jgi:hypothetical protein
MAAPWRGGIQLPPDLWKRALDAQRKGQSADGGWGYNGGDRAYGSMTTAGICAIALCRNAMGEKAPEVDPQIEQGLAWLSKHFSVRENLRCKDKLAGNLVQRDRRHRQEIALQVGRPPQIQSRAAHDLLRPSQ